jgi:hypothetical protein
MPSPAAAAPHPAPASPELLALWQSVLGNAPLLAAAAACDPADVAKVAQLRKKGSGPEVKVVLDLMLARQKAAVKFPVDLAGKIIADPQAVEQASSWAAAGWKAQRFKGAPLAIDLCCGGGFDALALASAGLRVEACDLDPVRTWMAQNNAALLPAGSQLALRHGDMAAYGDHAGLAEAFVHIDPARRNAFGRIFNLADYLPPPETWAPILRRAKGGCVKLAPGVVHTELAEFAGTLGVPWSTSFVSEGGRLTQALLWTGALAQTAPREAVLLKDGQTHTLAGNPGSPPMWDAWVGEPAFLFEADDAVERAQLAGMLSKPLNLFDLHPGLGLLAGAADAPSPWLTAFTVLESFSWDEKNARVALRAHDAGLVEVKTRGQTVDPNALEKKVRGEGKERLTLFVLRLGSSLRGYVTRRIKR